MQLVEVILKIPANLLTPGKSLTKRNFIFTSLSYKQTIEGALQAFRLNREAERATCRALIMFIYLVAPNQLSSPLREAKTARLQSLGRAFWKALIQLTAI